MVVWYAQKREAFTSCLLAGIVGAGITPLRRPLYLFPFKRFFAVFGHNKNIRIPTLLIKGIFPPITANTEKN